jgi:hypothetical protein
MTAPADHPAANLRATPYAIAIIVLGLAIFLPVTFLPGGTDAAPAERFAQMGAAFATIPGWVQQWMSFQHFVFAGSLLLCPMKRLVLAALLALLRLAARDSGSLLDLGQYLTLDALKGQQQAQRDAIDWLLRGQSRCWCWPVLPCLRVADGAFGAGRGDHDAGWRARSSAW